MKKRIALSTPYKPTGPAGAAARFGKDAKRCELACLHGRPQTPMWLAAWPLYCELLQPILSPMLSRVSFLHRENQLTKAPRLLVVMFRAAHAELFTFAQQRGCGNFKSCARNSRDRPSSH